MKKILFGLTVFALLSVPSAARADICDDLNDMADGWDTIATAVDELTYEGLTEAEAEECDEIIGEAHDETLEVADFLVNEGNEIEERSGMDIRRGLRLMRRAEDVDELLDGMDLVVDAIDDLVDYCDSL